MLFSLIGDFPIINKIIIPFFPFLIVIVFKNIFLRSIEKEIYYFFLCIEYNR